MSVISNMIKYYKAAYEVQTRMVWFPNVIDIKGHTVYHDSITVMGLGCQIAAAVILKDGGKIIVVDDEFLKLSEKTQLALIYHELGHFEYNHRESSFVRSVKMCLGFVSQNEIDADAYAAEIIGNVEMIDALTELHSITKQREIRQRIKLIQKRSVI
jgi:Zn-dependent protease with chaperone function